MLATPPPGGSFPGRGEWLPDSSQLAHTVALGTGVSALELVNADGTNRRRLFVAVEGFPVSWSPDGRRLTFSGQKRGQHAHVYVAAADGSSVRRLVPGDAFRPEWSPRGDWIVYGRGLHSTARDLWQIVRTHPNGTVMCQGRSKSDPRSAG